MSGFARLVPRFFSYPHIFSCSTYLLGESGNKILYILKVVVVYACKRYNLPFQILLTNESVSGAPFQWAAIFHKSDLAFTRGHQWLDFYNQSEKQQAHHLPCKVSCSYCHAPIIDEGRNILLLFPGLIEPESGLAQGGKRTETVRQAFEPRYVQSICVYATYCYSWRSVLH